MSLLGVNRAVLSLVLLVGSIAVSWGQVTTATILGTIKDPSGAVLPGAEVTIRNVGTGATRVVVSDQAGRYRAPQLSLGSYEVHAELAGFKTEVRQGIQLTVGREAVLDLLLQVGAVEETVTVTAEAPLLETTTASVSGLVDEKKMRDLPLNSRSIEQFVFLMPATAQHRNYTGGLKTGFTPKISAAGQRTDQNVFMLDGTDINDYAGNTPGSTAGTMAGVETIQEYQVLLHNYGAEFGRSTGAVVNLATRSGSNEFKGTLFEFVRNDVFDARNFFDREAPPFRRNQFGGVLGGPIVRDRTFFMGSYEALRQRLGVTNTSFVPDDNARQGILPETGNPGQTRVVGVNPSVKPYLELYPRANGRNVGGGVAAFVWPFSNRVTQDYSMARIDHRFNSDHSLFGRYTFDDTRAVRPLTFPQFESSQDIRSQFTTIAESAVLSPNAVNDFRVAFNRSAPAENPVPTFKWDPSLDFVPGQGPGKIQFGGPGGNITISGFGALTGWGAEDRGYWRRNVYQVTDNVNYVNGNHTLKFGGNFERLQTNTGQPRGPFGIYSFNSLLEFLQASPFRFDGSSGGGISGWRQNLLGLYLQDDYKPAQNLTLNLGLRYEIVSVLKEVNGRATNLDDPLDPTVRIGESFQRGNPSLRSVAPRLGLAWQPFSRTVLRMGVGVYHHQLMDRPYFFQSEGNSTDSERVEVRNPPFPRVTSFPPGSRGAVTVQVADNPTAIHYSLNIQREITANATAQIGYVGTRGYHIIRFSEGNTAFPVILEDGRKFYPAGLRRRNPNFSRVVRLTGDNTADYHGLTLGLQQRFARGLQFQASYTFSKALDEGSSMSGSDSRNEVGSRMDPFDRKRDRGLTAVDIRNNFVFNFTAELPIGPGKPLGGGTSGFVGGLLGGWELGGIATVQDGTPVSAWLGFNVSRDLDTSGKDRPNLKPGVTKVPILGSPEKYFDPSVFELPPAGFYGNAGRNIIIGPGLATVDVAMMKNTPLAESVNLQFRFEVFNLFNRANFGLPASVIFDSNGRVGRAGVISDTRTSSRELQFGLKLLF